MSGIKADIENHHLSREVMLAYKKGMLSPQEMHKVETLLLEDEFAAEAMEGFSVLDESRQNKNLQDLELKLKQRIKKANKSYYLWYAAAAALLLLMVSVFVIFSFQEIKDKQLSGKKDHKISSEQIASAPSSNSAMDDSKSEAQQQLLSRDIITENKNVPSSGHLSKPKTAPEPANEEDSQSEDVREISTLDSISGISPAVAQAMAEKKEETIELKSSQPPPLAGKPSPSAEHRLVGQVLSAENGKGISGVNIEIKGTTLTTKTDRQGNFSIPSTPGSTITFNRDGYYKEELKINDQKTVNITLDEVDNTNSSIASTEADNESAVTRKKSTDVAASARAKASSSLEKNKMQKFQEELENEIAKLNLKDLPDAVVISFEIQKDHSLNNFTFSQALNKEHENEIVTLFNRAFPHFFDTTQSGKMQVELKFKK